MKQLLILLILGQFNFASVTEIQVKLDISQSPHLKNWAKDAEALIRQWHPIISKQLKIKKNYSKAITLKFDKTYNGVAYSSGHTITVASSWVDKNPKDIGLVLHEMVHVIQAYPPNKFSWLTEGIADYFRWAVYQKKELKWFPSTKDKQGYKKSYRYTAGFLLWLETDVSPGIITKLNSAMYQGKFTLDTFKQRTGSTLDTLWEKYSRRAKVQ